jgi:hypothetical protein
MRYLLANLGDLRRQATLREFTLQDSAATSADLILSDAPALVAIGVYIWNRPQVEELVRRLRDQQPELPIVLGGPEIAHDTDSPLAHAATCVVCGEADRAFAGVCDHILQGREVPRVIHPDLPDLAHRLLYVETSRGCPYRCEYCISSITPGVRYFALDRILSALQRLLDRGARQFKLVDRSFNIQPEHAGTVLDFFLTRWQPGMRLHLEMTPGRLAPGLCERLRQFPPGGLHIEVGIQTLDASVARRVNRDMDPDLAEATLRFLINDVKADVHADLIAGLPGETPAAFVAGFNRLVALRPAEIQVGILKRLHGAPIARHAAEWALLFSPIPPYPILRTSRMDESCIDGIRRFSFHWDRFVNRRWLPRTVPLLWEGEDSAYHAFDAFSRVVEAQVGRHGFSLLAAAALLLEFLTGTRGLATDDVKRRLREDYADGGHRAGMPHFLREEPDTRRRSLTARDCTLE